MPRTLPAALRTDRLADQRLATDDDFLADLRLPGKAGRRLRAARAAGDRAASVAVVAEHYRTRSSPRWPFYMHGTPWPEINGRGKVLDKAEALMASPPRLRGSWPPFAETSMGALGADDWQRVLGQVGGSVTRNTFVVELSTAFALTGRVEHLTRALELIRSFVAAFPFVLEEGFDEDHDRHFGGGPNNAGDCYARSKRWLDLMHCGALQLPGVFSDEDVFWLVKQCWFYAKQYERLVGDEMRRDNHHLTDHGQAPFFYGAMFPEFAGASRWLAYARRVIRHHFASNLLPDDCYAEHCTKYQYHILYMYFAPWSVARANGIRLFTPREERRLRAWIGFLASMAKPDGVLAEFGDEFGGSLAQLFNTLATPVMDRELAAIGGALGYSAGELCTESAASVAKRLAGWDGAAPRIGLSPWYDGAPAPATAAPKAPSTRTWPNGGFSVFRSAWSRDADFLAVSHYRDSIPHGHTHWDMLSFVLHTGGQTLIGDPATWLYTDPGAYKRPDAREVRGYSYAVDAHNCLVMDDDTLKPLKALGHPCSWGGSPPRHGTGLFRAGGAIEVLEAWHDAHAPTRHRRFVVHVRGVGFVFVDLLSRAGLDLRPRQYGQRFHAEGDVMPSSTAPAPGAAVRLERGGATCWIVPGGEAYNSWTAWQDQRLDGVTGIPAARVRGGPWVLELTRRIEGPSAFITGLITGHVDAPGARYLGSRPQAEGFRQHDALAADAIDLGARGTLYVATCPYRTPLETPELATDAELAVAHVDARGRVAAWAMARGSSLRVGKRTLAKGRRAPWREG
ncbi:MAG TPA: heparinase II/III family protein [Planctomycetota bacterium]|nr:heparinase II/III family protein [Planctomycetota bacterium]